MQNVKGTLFVVATPIGNLQDITLRAVDVLKKVDRIAAEDTRHSASLLKHFSIEKPTLSLHEFNERERSALIIDFLQRGESIALISDAGTPLISDPGFDVVRKAKAAGMNVIPIPGACAAIAALSVSGLPTDRFVFEGFLPAKQEKCRHYLISLLHETRTMVFYEAPQRLLSTLSIMMDVFGGHRMAVVARELTKLYESIVSNDLASINQYFKVHTDEVRGEIVILVAGAQIEELATKEVIPEKVLDILLTELPLKQAVSLASKITDVRKNVLYELALTKKSGKEN